MIYESSCKPGPLPQQNDAAVPMNAAMKECLKNIEYLRDNFYIFKDEVGFSLHEEEEINEIIDTKNPDEEFLKQKCPKIERFVKKIQSNVNQIKIKRIWKEFHQWKIYIKNNTTFTK